MRLISTLALVLACAACQSALDATQIATDPGQTQPSQPNCRQFAAPVTAGGTAEQASGRACQQPDGSWRVVQDTPGLPAQEYVVPRPDQANPQPPRQQIADALPTADQPACSRYTVPIIVGGQQQQAAVEACPQPDGGWRITQNTPGLPPQVYIVPPPANSPYPYGYPYPADYAYPDFFPYWAGAPWFFGLAPSIVVVQRSNRFPHHFGHGFARGFNRGFGRGFAAARGGGGRR